MMQGNDLSAYYTVSHAVVVEPTIINTAVPMGRLHRRRFDKGDERAVDARFEQYDIHTIVMQWMARQGYAYSISFEVWDFSFGSKGRAMFFERVCDMIENTTGRYVSAYRLWNTPREAVGGLLTGSVDTVYDGDGSRCDEFWRMRGHRVLPGEAP